MEAIPLTDATAETVAKAFVTNWVSRFGVPAMVTTDQGRQFESSWWSELMKVMGTHRIPKAIAHGFFQKMASKSSQIFITFSDTYSCTLCSYAVQKV